MPINEKNMLQRIHMKSNISPTMAPMECTDCIQVFIITCKFVMNLQ